MSYALGYLGTNGSSAAGPIGAVALLRGDLERVAAEATRFLQPGFRFQKSEFIRLMNAFRRRDGESQPETSARVAQSVRELSGDEVQQLIAGTVGAIGEAIVRATAIAELPADGPEARAANHQKQASVTGPARLMWDSLNEMLRTMRPRSSAAAGLGTPVHVGIVVALVIAGAIVVVAAIAAGTYLADGYFRLQHATAEAEQVCRRNGGCTPEQYARIRSELRVGPFDAALAEFGRAAGEGIGTTVMAIGIGAAVLGAGALFWFGGGKDWMMRKLAKKERRQGRQTQSGYA